MRTINYKEAENKYGSEYEGEILGIKTADWKNPQDILLGIDQQLKQYGLEIVQINDGCDSYAWLIDLIDYNSPQKYLP